MPRFVCVLALVLAVIVSPSYAGQAFHDGDFGSWSFGGGALSSVVREPTGGNPGSRLRVEAGALGPSGGGVTALKHDYVTTEPLNGATFTLLIDVLAGSGNPHGITLLLEQYGTLYTSVGLGSSGQPGAFTTLSFSGTLNAGMFTRIHDGPGPLNPDFNSNVPTRFGFTSSSLGVQNVTYYDNIRLELSASPSPCAGFADVADTDDFCGAVSWIRNRLITLGCEAQEYCPGANVTRAQMALFMSRLGAALAPVVLYREIEFPNVTIASSAPGTPTCLTASYTVIGYPRVARVAGTISATASVGPAALQAYWQYSIDQGNSWTTMGPMPVQAGAGGAGDTASAGVRAPPMQLRPGNIYRFGMFVDGMGATPTFAPLKCQADVLIFDDSRP